MECAAQPGTSVICVVGSVKGVCHPFPMGASRKVGAGMREDQPLDRVSALPSSAPLGPASTYDNPSSRLGSMRWTHRPLGEAADEGASS